VLERLADVYASMQKTKLVFFGWFPHQCLAAADSCQMRADRLPT
jgi:hypothetical protein